MRVLFYASDKERERVLCEAFLEGVRRHGDTGEARRLGGGEKPEGDVACMVGVKSRELFRAQEAAGVVPVMLDKGYVRHRQEGARTWEYWRVAVGSHHPTRGLMRVVRPDDRWRRLGLRAEPWRGRGMHIVLAGSSAKYHDFYGLPAPTEYAQKLVRRLRRLTKREIVYRPKPSWRDAVEIERTRYSGAGESIVTALRGAHALVTHGSNACFEAVLAGVPCIVLGEGVAAPISSRMLDSIEHPHLASARQRQQWLANLAYCQWTVEEFRSGEAWGVIREQINA